MNGLPGRAWVGFVLCMAVGCREHPSHHAPPPPAAEVPAGAAPPAPKTTVTVPKKIVKPTRRFLEVGGQVELNHHLVTGAVDIPDDALISTGPDGYAVITLVPGSAIQIRPNTTVDVGRWEGHAIPINLHVGVVWALLPAERVVNLTTPTALAKVHGTEFYAHTDRTKATDLCACQGDAHMQSPDGKAFNQRVSSPHHEHQGVHFAKRGRRYLAARRPKGVHSSAGEADLSRWAAVTLTP